jgi:hypothetical protein
MFGGLKKSASRLALVAAAGVLSTGAYAADLGGDCCADLEERVAELEATTARKGNRRMSLQVYGWVNKTIMSYDFKDPGGLAVHGRGDKGTYLGLDNTNSATRFGFRGDAKISPSVKAGYSILLDVFTGGTTARATRNSEDGLANGAGTTSANDDHLIRMRDANVWMESSTVGRVTLGRLTVSGPQGTIDLAGIGNVGSGSQSLVGNNLQFIGAPGSAAGTPSLTLGGITDGAADYNNRVDGLKWDSPTFAGFVVGASIGEALSQDRNTSRGPLYAVNLRYAGEFSGVRLAAAVGYEVGKAEETMGSGNLGVATSRPDSKNLGLSLSAMHAPTGLFAQGHWLRFDRGNDVLPANVNATTGGTSDRATNWLVQAGIAQNWFGIGATALYGEYSKVNNGAAVFGDRSGGTAAGAWDALAAVGVESRYTMWGLGVNQNIDAAAMQVYAGYRNHKLDFEGAGINARANTLGIFMAGARVNF